jgi:hypothetical protein
MIAQLRIGERFHYADSRISYEARYPHSMISGSQMKQTDTQAQQLAAQLTKASIDPHGLAAKVQESSAQVKLGKGKGPRSVSVFLRIPPELHAKLESEAVTRTKATGKGVTIQQIILERAARP